MVTPPAVGAFNSKQRSTRICSKGDLGRFSYERRKQGSGAWPSGKAPVFGTGIRRFESFRPSHYRRLAPRILATGHLGGRSELKNRLAGLRLARRILTANTI